MRLDPVITAGIRRRREGDDDNADTSPVAEPGRRSRARGVPVGPRLHSGLRRGLDDRLERPESPPQSRRRLRNAGARGSSTKGAPEGHRRSAPADDRPRRCEETLYLFIGCGRPSGGSFAGFSP
jgi:hypothetical protein